MQLNIFLAFFRIGIFGFGGGPSSIPLVHKEVVERNKWMNSDEFSDILALGNALPGPINTKMAGYIGYRVGGIPGMINAIFATTVPSILMMIIILTVLNAYKDKPWVSGMSSAVVPVVGAMLGKLTWDFVIRSRKSDLGWRWTLLFIVGSIIVLQALHIHPAILIFALLIGALIKRNPGSAGTLKKEPIK